jgi:hypothetical protein
MPVILIRKSMYVRFLIFLLVGISLVSSCKKEDCEGYDQIIEINDLFLVGDDTLQYFGNVPNQFFGISLSIYDGVKTKDGNRQCTQENLAVQFKDEWDEKEISLTCDKELNSGSQTFRANSELIGTSICRLTFKKGLGNQLSNGKIDLIGVDDINQSEDYLFTLKMETTSNRKFTSTETIYIKQ